VRLRTILAPMDGVVVSRSHDVGEAVTVAQPLFRIFDLSRVVVQVAVPPKDLRVLVPGRKVKVSLTQAAEPRVVDGEVVLVDPFADAEGKVRVRVVVDNAERRIRSGLKALVDIPRLE